MAFTGEFQFPTISQNVRPNVSLEYFPPNGLSSERALLTGAHALRRFDPAYQTVTFGAGGSATEGTLDWCLQLQTLNNVPTAAHLALCHFDAAQSVRSFAEELWDNGIERLVLLRGDVSGADGIDGLAGYISVADAVADLKGLRPFDISVSAYPEVHPLAVSQSVDFDVLLAKQDSGADRAITQYFFENDDFFRFRDEALKRGFKKEIVPGVIPISNFEKIKKFSEKCGAAVPSRFDELFASAGNDKASHTKIARSIIEEQVRNLAHNDVSSLHIYTLNRVDLTADAIRAFQAEFDGETEEFRPALVG